MSSLPREMDLTKVALPFSHRPRISVEFVVLHYTVESLEDTLRLLSDPDSAVSAHLVIAQDGAVHELVPCWDGLAYRAGHAGRSRWTDEDVTWESFNEFSIGIEIVNKNGNLFPYSDEQYESLVTCLQHLRYIYPSLARPERILGHEQIAGWRGKVDPGSFFDWHRIFALAYPGMNHPARPTAFPPELAAALRSFEVAEPSDPDAASRYWRAVNLYTEAAVALISAERGG